jgi:allantoinase
VPGLDTVIRAERAIIGDTERPAAVGIRGGRVEHVTDIRDALAAEREVHLDAKHVLMPGLVDTHVHLQDPGHADWEGFDTGSRAAVRGGITCLVDMPLDSLPVTVDVAALEAKRGAAAGRVFVDVGFWGGLVPGNVAELEPLHRAGALGAKCFLADTGLAEFPPVSVEELRTALCALREFDGLLLVHAENCASLAGVPAQAGRSYQRYLGARPARIEETAVAAVIDAVRDTGGRAHIVHVSSASSAELLARARQEGLPVTAETCPHYLTLSAEEVPDGATTFKAAPPIRDGANREALWRHVAAGTLGLIVSDHSPSAIEHKSLDTGDFDTALGGISSLQIALPVVWTQARRRGHSLVDVARWMSTRPAELAGLASKGAIAPGRDADLCVIAPDDSFVVDVAALEHRQPISPYAGRELHGVVEQTWLRGRPISLDAAPRGRLLTRAPVPARATAPAPAG